MTLTQFIKKYLGQKVDFDKAHGYQCVDLVRAYFAEVLNIPQPPGVEGAKDLFDNPGCLTAVKESAQTDYSQGDVLIWDATDKNKYGHVAILVAIYNTGNFIVLEQDGFKQDGVKLAFRTRENLKGYLWKRQKQ